MTQTPLPRTALVTDGWARQNLSAVRSLGKAGFRVVVMGDSLFTMSFWSRYVQRRVNAPLAADNAELFGEALLRELKRAPETVLLPVSDPSVAWVSSNLKTVREYARVLVPPLPSFELAKDKGATIAVATELGLPTPRTWHPQTPEELLNIVSGLEPGTFVVKPRQGTGSFGIVYGQQADRAFWMEHWSRFGALLVQERIPPQGRALGVSLLLDQAGVCRAIFAHERLNQYPRSGGPSTDRRSIHVPELVQASLTLLQRLSWRGVAMIEWKVDPRDGKPKLMEINGRFWGSMELAVRSGVDFPMIYARMVCGEPCEPPPEYPDGTRCRWLIPGDILRYATQPASERESLREFLRGLPHTAEEWDTHDLLGCVSSMVCTASMCFRPRFWKFLCR